MKQDQLIQTAIRIPKTTLARADKIAERLDNSSRRYTRADALRLAMLEGLSVLENEERKKR